MLPDDVIVTGPRIRGKAAEAPASTGGVWVPSSWLSKVAAGSSNGGNGAQIYGPVFDGPEPIVIGIAGTDIVAYISAADWAEMPTNLKRAITGMLANWQKSPDLTRAITHAVAHGVPVIEFTYGTQYTRQRDGVTFSFINSGSGKQAAVVDYVDNNPNGDRTDIEFGTKIAIHINQDAYNDPATHQTSATAQIYRWLRTIGHELMHASTPDTDALGRHGPGTDEPAVRAAEERIGGMEAVLIQGAGAIAGSAMVGSQEAEHLQGLDGNDALAGLGGDDRIAGGGGSNLLYGGSGRDLLVSAGEYDVMEGGLDADTYEVTAASKRPIIAEEGGVDLIRLPGHIGDYTVYRAGDDLILFASHPQGEITLVNQLGPDGSFRIELFEFAGTTYAASYVESLIAGPGGDPDTPIQGASSPGGAAAAAMVVIDLDGDGISLGDPDAAGIAIDVDGDGVAERLSGIGPHDGLLVLDRDGDGLVSDLAELSFVGDQRGAATGLEGLLAFDGDRDGFLTAADAVFARLLVWVDADGDGVSQAGEMHRLDDLGITAIGLEVFGRRLSDTGQASGPLGSWSDVHTGARPLRAFDAVFAVERNDRRDDPDEDALTTPSDFAGDQPPLPQAMEVIGA